MPSRKKPKSQLPPTLDQLRDRLYYRLKNRAAPDGVLGLYEVLHGVVNDVLALERDGNADELYAYMNTVEEFSNLAGLISSGIFRSWAALETGEDDDVVGTTD